MIETLNQRSENCDHIHTNNNLIDLTKIKTRKTGNICKVYSLLSLQIGKVKIKLDIY